jgi:phosphate-selective porin OprO and OprP
MGATRMSASRRFNLKKTALAAAVSGAMTFGFWHAPAYADAIDDLLEKLKAKGVLTEEEFKDFKDVREGEKAVNRKRRQEQAEKDTKAEDRSKVEMVGAFNDGIRWETADKKNSIGLNGRLQLDYRNFSGDDVLNANTFDLRRAYLTVAGKFWEYYTFDVTGDFASIAGPSASACTAVGVTSATDPTPRCTATATVPTGTSGYLDVAWLNVGWWESAQLRFGQFKMPMSIEELTSSRFIDFQERSLLNQFVPAKERGIMLHGVPTPGVFYGVAVSNGQGKNGNETNNNVDSSDYIGRVGVNIAELIGQKNAVYHIAAGYTTGTIPPAAAPTARTEGRGISFFAPTAFGGSDLDRERTGLEASVAFGPVKLQSEYLKVKFSGTAGANAFDRNIDVWYGEVNWLITGEAWADAYRNGAYGRIRPKNNFSPKGGGWGAWELGLRFTNFDAGDFVSTNPSGTGVLPATLTNKAKGLTLGLKWLPTPNTRFLLNYIETKFDTPVTVTNSGQTGTTDKEKAITFRAQFDF